MILVPSVYAQNVDIKTVNTVEVVRIHGGVTQVQMRLFDMPPGIAVPGWSNSDVNGDYKFYFEDGTVCTKNNSVSIVSCVKGDINFTISNVTDNSVISSESDEYQLQTDSWGNFRYVFESFFDQKTESFQCLGKVKNSTTNAKSKVVTMKATYKNQKSLETILKVFTNIYPN